MNELQLELERKLIWDNYVIPRQHKWWKITCSRCNKQKPMVAQTTKYYNDELKFGQESTQICQDCFDELSLINHSDKIPQRQNNRQVNEK